MITIHKYFYTVKTDSMGNIEIISPDDKTVFMQGDDASNFVENLDDIDKASVTLKKQETAHNLKDNLCSNYF